MLISGIKILKEYERGGRSSASAAWSASRGPGIVYVIPLIEKMQRIELRTVTMDVPPQDVITRDNVSVKVSAVLYFRVIDPNRAIVEVADYLFATSQLAQTTLRSVCGQARARRAAGGAREDQHAAAGDPRHADRPVGHQGGHASR